MSTREASHAGSWYSSNSEFYLFSFSLRRFCCLALQLNKTHILSYIQLSVVYCLRHIEKELDSQLTGWLAKAGTETTQGDAVPILGLRAVIAP